MVKKRTYGYDEFKLKENVDMRFKTTEYEDDVQSIDDLDIDNDSESDEVEEVESAPEEVDVEETSEEKPIDVGNETSDVSLETINTYLEFINGTISSLNKLVKKAETVKIDKPTENKIISIYKAIQGI